MAIYRLSVSVISRSSGRSAVAAAAYRAGEEIRNEREGRDHDYSRRSGVELTEIIAPGHAPEWALDRSALWNAAEISEKRKDAQTAREVLLTLPHELGAEERQALVRGFVSEQFVARGMVADIAHHAPHREGDERNHHAHVMLTTRAITRDGFGQKERAWNDKELLQTWREQWEQHLNRSLERAGIEQRLDHRSLKAQHEEALELAAGEVDPAMRARWEAKAAETGREPEPKLGAAAAMERRGIRTALGDVVRELREIRETVKERAGQIIERGVEAAQEWRGRINDQLQAMLQGRAERREQQLAQALLERERQREEERRRELEREREQRRIEHEKMLEMIKERSRDRGMSR